MLRKGVSQETCQRCGGKVSKFYISKNPSVLYGGKVPEVQTHPDVEIEACEQCDKGTFALGHVQDLPDLHRYLNRESMSSTERHYHFGSKD